MQCPSVIVSQTIKEGALAKKELNTERKGRMESLAIYLEDVVNRQTKYQKEKSGMEIMGEKENKFIALLQQRNKMDKRIKKLKEEILEEQQSKNPAGKKFLIFGSENTWVELYKKADGERFNKGVKEAIKNKIIERYEFEMVIDHFKLKNKKDYKDIKTELTRKARNEAHKIWKRDFVGPFNGGWCVSSVKDPNKS